MSVGLEIHVGASSFLELKFLERASARIPLVILYAELGLCKLHMKIIFIELQLSRIDP